MATPSDNCSSLAPPTAEGQLLAWLLEALQPMNRTRVKQLLRRGQVSVNGTATTRHDYRLYPGDRVVIAHQGCVSAGRDLEKAGMSIVMEDDTLVVIDKPPGLLTVATESERTDTAFARLKAHLMARGLSRPFVVHRLDRETSGLLLFSKSAAVRDHLQANWGAVTKTYFAVVEGMPREAEGLVENYLLEGRDLRVRVVPGGVGAKLAATRYRVMATHGRYTLLQVVLGTGRKHQIRVHLTGLGCPVIGDLVYGSASNPAGRLGLHAGRIALNHPKTRQRLELESPLPATLQRVLG